MDNTGYIFVFEEKIDKNTQITIALFGRDKEDDIYKLLGKYYKGEYSLDFLKRRFVFRRVHISEFEHIGNQVYLYEGKEYKLNPKLIIVHLDNSEISIS